MGFLSLSPLYLLFTMMAILLLLHFVLGIVCMFNYTLTDYLLLLEISPCPALYVVNRPPIIIRLEVIIFVCAVCGFERRNASRIGQEKGRDHEILKSFPESIQLLPTSLSSRRIHQEWLVRWLAAGGWMDGLFSPVRE